MVLDLVDEMFEPAAVAEDSAATEAADTVVAEASAVVATVDSPATAERLPSRLPPEVVPLGGKRSCRFGFSKFRPTARYPLRL